MRSYTVLFTAATAMSVLAAAADVPEVPEVPPIDWKVETGFIGCFEGAGVKMKQTDLEVVTLGTCRGLCERQNSRYASMEGGDTCYCGETLPDEKFLSDYLKCDLSCHTYPQDSCGGDGYYYIFLVNPALRDPRRWDWKKNPEHDPDEEPKTSSQDVISTTKQGTVVITLPPTTTPDESSQEPEAGDSGINKAGAAAGAVVGVLILISLAVGAFLFIRKQKRRKVEEEYRRSLAVREFAKKPEPDLRLDPVMLHRRMSDGSIADNQDYSRRILKVTNPDGN